MNSQVIKNKIKKLPDGPGVYFFRRGKEILYIGKATSLRDRVRSYFGSGIENTRGPIISKMLGQFDDIKFQKTDSVLEALILEANLIKKHQPPANTAEKDDKSFNYVVITKEKFPRVLVVRGKELENIRSHSLNSHHSYIGMSLDKQFGPFPNGSQLKEAMKIVRKMFPWRGKNCFPPEPHPTLSLIKEREDNQTRIPRVPSPEQGEGDAKRGVRLPRACFERQLGLCPGVCTGEISQKDYAKQIKNIVLFFEGNKKKLIKNLEKEMKTLAKMREFEKAEKVKRQMFALYHIQDVSLIKSEKMRSISDPDKTLRIESYDIAHLSGTNVVGVMTVVEDGEIKKTDYRKFKIKTATVDDTKALSEVLSRRLGHPEWPTPNLIVVDGGTAQKRAMEKVLKQNDLKIPVVSVVKDERHRPREIIGIERLKDLKIEDLERQILLSNAEAHRFAIGFHKHLRGKLR